MGVTFTVGRMELKRVLTALGVSERSIDDMLAEMNRQHRHVNVVAFAGMLQKVGLDPDEAANVLRRIGVDDVSIASAFDTLDEERIKGAYGKVVDLVVE
jgi:hypothetical protein